MFLDEVLETKRRELAELRGSGRARELRAIARDLPAPRGFCRALEAASGHGVAGSKPVGDVALIAEIKKASPSRGRICPDERFKPEIFATVYERAGASAISVLTDRKYFQGDLIHLSLAKRATILPVLRKDFLIDPLQLWEARAAGADAVLLIAAALSPGRMAEMVEQARELQLDVLLEVHNREELDVALRTGVRTIGINNRNLRTLETDLRTTFQLASLVPRDRLLVSESGIRNREEVSSLKAAGVKAVLVGETLLTAKDMAAGVRELVGPDQWIEGFERAPGRKVGSLEGY